MKEVDMMRFKWWGHSCFLIENEGLKIITDPYDDSLPYKRVDDKPDLVTVSHDHFDHNAVDRLEGDFEVINSREGYSDEQITINAIQTYHDKSEGEDRGDNLIFIMKFADKTVCHMGDIGHLLSDKVINKLQDVDILLIPVGGYYTINADEAYEIAKVLEPDLILPMHYKTDILEFPISTIEAFTDKFNKDEIKLINGPEFDLNDLSDEKVVVLDYLR